MKEAITVPAWLKNKQATKQDQIYKAIQGKSYSQIKTWMDANVNNLADARRVLALIVTMLGARQ